MKFPKFRSEPVIDPRFVSMVGVTEGTQWKLAAIMGDRPANEVVAELIEERYRTSADDRAARHIEADIARLRKEFQKHRP